MSCKFPDRNIFLHLYERMDSLNHSRWKRIRRFLRQRYRLVILNDTTFGEKFSLRMSPWGIIIGTLALSIVLIALTISTIAFTTLREYIPGYGDVTERKEILELSIRADSIEQTLETRDRYIGSVLTVFAEKPETKSAKPNIDTTGKYAKINIKPSSADIQFRKEYELKQGKSDANVAKLIYADLGELVFFTPVKGLISTSYNATEEHFGVDIVTREDETVKSTLDGTIIFTGFSAEDGNVVQVQHANNTISIYKHCAALLKTTGTPLKAGDAIAVVGNTGENSNGPHLHFELWYNGAPVNPTEFIAF